MTDIVFLGFRDPLHPALAGGDIYLNKMAEAVAAEGFDVTFLCSRNRGRSQTESINGVHYVRLGGDYSLCVEAWKFYTAHLRNRAALVVEEAIGAARIPFFAKAYVRCPHLAIWHQRNLPIFMNQFPFPIALIPSAMEYMLGHFDRKSSIVVPSSKTRVDIVSVGIKLETCHVISPGLDRYWFSSTPPPIQGRKRRIVVLGKIRRYKMIHHVIQALAMVPEPDVSLAIIGRTDEWRYEEYLQSLSASLGVEERIEFFKDVSEDQKKHLLETSRVLVAASPIEGFGIAILEANSRGTPVLASDGVPHEAVANNVNGLVYSFGNIQALAKMIHLLITNDSVWERLSHNAFVRSKQFSWETSTRKFVKLVVDLLGADGPRANRCIG